MPDRTKEPLIRTIDSLELPELKVHQLDNGIPLYELQLGLEEVLKLEIVYKAGRPFEHKRLVGRATSRMLKEGAGSMNSQEIAEKMDYYGGTLSVPSNLDTSNISLYCLTKHFKKLVPVLAEILYHPGFPQKELDTFVRNSQRQLQVDLSKSDVVAYRKITELIYGSDHPYGYNSTVNDYVALTRDDLLSHFQNCYTSANCQIFISGKTNDEVIGMINQYLGQVRSDHQPVMNAFPPIPQQTDKVRVRHEGHVQTSIRVGCALFSRKHPDYKSFYILNTILGGYFGSRLMANIREEKGYTYNIYSTVDQMLYGGYFYIGTEVGNQYTEATLAEIYKEMERLKKELVPPDELQMVRNYLLGTLMSSLDGPFNVAEIVRNMILEELEFNEFSELVQLINSISPEQIRSIAQKYLNTEKMWEVVVGN